MKEILKSPVLFVKIQCAPRKISDEASRRRFVRNCLPKNANGGTSIGSGLLRGVQNLGKMKWWRKRKGGKDRMESWAERYRLQKDGGGV